MLVDGWRRQLRYLRVSLTDRCNLRCAYCMPEGGVPLGRHQDILRLEEVATVVRVAVEEGVRVVRLTGGEPLIRRGCVELVQWLSAMPGVEDVSLTTNGVLLVGLASRLREAGLRRVNIGLPSLDPAVYRELTRGGELQAALDGLAAARAAGFSPIKLNVVVLRGVNDDLGAFLELSRSQPVEVRFIEYMPIGPLDGPRYLVTADEIRERIQAAGPVEAAEPLKGEGPARHELRLPGAVGSLAIIGAVSEHPCATCNRLRLTADGHLRLCLLSEQEIDLRPALRPDVDLLRLRQLLAAAAAEKPARMAEGAPNGRAMSQIGG